MKKSTNHLKYVKQDPIRKALINRFLEELAHSVKDIKPKKILDAGSGEGFVLSYLAGKGITADCVGIDVSSQAVKVAQEHLPQFTFKKASIYKLPFKDKSFDVVLCNEVLEHLDKPEKALKELMRVSKKHVILSVPHEPWFMMGSLMGGKYIKDFGNHPEHINHWSWSKFRKYLEAHGLKVTMVHWAKTFPWSLAVCTK